MPDKEHSDRARIVFGPEELDYEFGPSHPLQARRLVALMDLLQTSGLWQESNDLTRLPLRAASVEELSQIYTAAYIAAVQRLSQPGGEGSEQEQEERSRLALHYGFGEGDTPVLPDMHATCSYIVGGSLVAASAIMGLPAGGSFSGQDEQPLHVFHPGGGLHHAWSDRASGFCVYNDIAVAIAYVLRASEAKVLYIDFDAHHGDGVQRAFYDDPRVMTISVHETGRYLFPGTGEVLELGRGMGRGYAVNVPLEPFTEDDLYIQVIQSLLHLLVTSFAPDLIISQHGCDTHAWDPLTHLKLTLRAIQVQSQLAHQLAHEYCQGRWLATGGGGYDLFRVVPRAWSMLWAEMSQQTLPEELPQVWISRWRPAWQAARKQEEAAQQVMGKSTARNEFPTTFKDHPGDFPAQPRHWSISRANEHTAALVRHLLVPSSVRLAFPARQRRSPLAGLIDLLHPRGAATPSRSKILATRKGQLLLRDFCPPSLVERLRADSGLKAFARLPEREKQLLVGISRNPDCVLTLAHTPTGEIVGQVTIAPADAWWEGIDNIYEVAIEVSSNWRGLGIARDLLAFALELDALEDMILFAIGLSWHWDTEDLDLSPYRYRELIARLFASQGFAEYQTTEPNVIMEPANILLARVGKRVDQRVASQFYRRVLSSPNLSLL